MSITDDKTHQTTLGTWSSGLVDGGGDEWSAWVDGPTRPTREEAAGDRRRMVEALEGADEVRGLRAGLQAQQTWSAALSEELERAQADAAELRARLATVTNDLNHWKRVASERSSGGVLSGLVRRLLRPERVR